MLHATYLLNRLPSTVIEWETPYESLFKRKASYSEIKFFGCLCFSTNPKPHKNKFAPKSSKCVFMGFSPTKKVTSSMI